MWAMQHFSRGRAGNPFELPHVHATSHIEALNTLPNNSQLVVFAPLASLSVGLARDLLINCGWAGDPANTVLLPLGGGAPGSMAAQLAAHAAAARGGGRRGPQHLRVEVAWRVPLSDDELRERKAAEAAALRIKVCPLATPPLISGVTPDRVDVTLRRFCLLPNSPCSGQCM